MFAVLLPNVVAEPIAVLTKPGVWAAMLPAALAVEPKKNVLILFPVTALARAEDEILVLVPRATFAASSMLPPML